MSAREVIANHRIGYPKTPDGLLLGSVHADAILSALDKAGYAVVPVQPTEAMRVAAVSTHPPEFFGDKPLYEKCWRAMITAAKETP